ncbi:hypothetical protein EGT07_04160 [Herbaspirillum sp. HC18]|nr:hypothetical protein EGT07_04160 [Herbaspirillum sp. HC18]
MLTPLVRIYDNFIAAQHARDQLLASGFSHGSVHLDSMLDEAGPVEGNAVLDAKDTGKGPGKGALSKLLGVEERTDAYNNATPVWRDTFVLSVDIEDETQRSQASVIMNRFGARAIDDFTSWRRHES